LTTVDIPAEIPATFEIDASQACNSAIEGIDDCDQAGTAPAPMKIELDPIEIDLNVDIVEQTGDKGKRIENAFDRLESVTVTRVDWEVRNNSLSFDLPKTQLHLGPKDATSHDGDGSEGVFKLAEIPSVPAGTDESGSTEVDQATQSEVSSLLKGGQQSGGDQKDKDPLKFSAIPYTEPVIEQGQDVPPNGSATVEVTIHAEFVATPKSVVNN
jgi:hypothetical protein